MQHIDPEYKNPQIPDIDPHRTLLSIKQDHLDHNADLEEHLIDQAQIKLIYTTLFWTGTLLLLNFIAW